MLLVFLWSAYFVHTWPTFYESNQYIRLHQAEALVVDGTFSIDKAMARYGVRNEDLALFKGKAYCDKAIAHPLMGAAVYAVFRWMLPDLSANLSADRWVYLLTVFLNTLAHLLGVYAFLRINRLLGLSRRAALGAGLVYGLCGPSFLYSSLYFGHQLAATSGLLALWLLLDAEHKAEERGYWASWSLLGAGFCTAQVVAVEYSAIWVGVCLSLFALVLLRAPSRAALFLLGALPWTLAVLLHNWIIFEHPLHTGYHYKFEGLGLTIGKFQDTLFGFRLPGLLDYARQLFLPARGLFFWAPVLLLALPGVYKLSKPGAHRRLGLLCAGVVLGHTTLIAAFVDWTAGYTAAPRTLVVMLPFLCLGLGPILDATDKYTALVVRWLFVPLSLLSFAHALVVVSTFPFHAPVFSNPIYALSWPLFLDGYLAQNWGQMLFGLRGHYGLIPLIFFSAVLVGAFVVRGPLKLPEHRPVVHLTIWMGLTVLLMLAGVAVKPPEPSRATAATTADILSVMDYPEAAEGYRKAAQPLPR